MKTEFLIYLMELHLYDTLYNEYFVWKNYYNIEAGVIQMARNRFCQLCEKLHRTEEPNKHYDSLKEDWSMDSNCIVPDENFIGQTNSKSPKKLNWSFFEP